MKEEKILKSMVAANCIKLNVYPALHVIFIIIRAMRKEKKKKSKSPAIISNKRRWQSG